MATFGVRGAYITLGQFVKEVGWVDTGGGARGFLASAAVFVNGEAENRRGRKLFVGDTVAVGDATYTMISAPAREEEPAVESGEPAVAHTAGEADAAGSADTEGDAASGVMGSEAVRGSSGAEVGAAEAASGDSAVAPLPV